LVATNDASKRQLQILQLSGKMSKDKVRAIQRFR
jgi:hypothetical protein